MKIRSTRVGGVFAAVALSFAWGARAQSVDEAAATALMKKSGCLKCHAVSSKKDGPSFQETAAKYKGKPDGEQKLTTFVTTGPKIKVDGKEETHEALKGADAAATKNIVQYILSR
jgi:cytochrome c